MKRRYIYILAWLAIPVIATLFMVARTNKPTPVSITPAGGHVQISDNNKKPVTTATPATTAVDYRSGADVLGSPVHKAASTPVKSYTVAQNSGPSAVLVHSNVSITPAIDTSQSTKDPTPPDPNRPYYDGWGNKLAYDGTLISAACPNVPANGKDNPYCVCPAGTAEYTQYLMGYDKNQGAAVCHVEYYHPCPYTEGAPIDSPMCDKSALGQ